MEFKFKGRLIKIDIKRELLTPPNYAVFYTVGLFFFNVFLFISVGLRFSQKLVLYYFASYLLLLVYWLLEIILKRYEIGRTVLNLLLMWFCLSLLFILVDGIRNFSMNREDNYYSFTKDNETIKEYSTQEVQNQSNISIIKENGKLQFSGNEDDKISFSSKTYFDDEVLIIEEVQNDKTQNFFIKQDTYQVNPNRVFFNNQPEYKISPPTKVLYDQISLTSKDSTNNIDFTGLVFNKLNIHFKNGNHSIKFNGNNEAEAFVNLEDSIFDTSQLSLIRKSNLDCKNSKGELRFEESLEISTIDITSKNCILEILINEEIAYEINYENKGFLQIDDAKIQVQKGQTLSLEHDKKNTKVTINLQSDFNTKILINKE